MARRLVEAGVRFVQVFPPLEPDFNPWDHHSSLESGMRTICNGTDQPFAALIRDLKERGLLDTTIVLWTGELGRLPTTQPNASAGNGRDHNRHAFSLVLAGGGFKKGFAYGETDEFGYKAVVNRVSVPDLPRFCTRSASTMLVWSIPTTGYKRPPPTPESTSHG